MASEMGRLDFVSALLAIIAIIIGVAAIPLFLFLRYRAEKVARDEVREQFEALSNRLESEAISILEQKLPILIEEYMGLMRNAVEADEADKIAEAQDDDGDHNDGI